MSEPEIRGAVEQTIVMGGLPRNLIPGRFVVLYAGNRPGDDPFSRTAINNISPDVAHFTHITGNPVFEESKMWFYSVVKAVAPHVQNSGDVNILDLPLADGIPGNIRNGFDSLLQLKWELEEAIEEEKVADLREYEGDENKSVLIRGWSDQSRQIHGVDWIAWLRKKGKENALVGLLDGTKDNIDKLILPLEAAGTLTVLTASNFDSQVTIAAIRTTGSTVAETQFVTTDILKEHGVMYFDTFGHLWYPDQKDPAMLFLHEPFFRLRDREAKGFENELRILDAQVRKATNKGIPVTILGCAAPWEYMNQTNNEPALTTATSNKQVWESASVLMHRFFKKASPNNRLQYVASQNGLWRINADGEKIPLHHHFLARSDLKGAPIVTSEKMLQSGVHVVIHHIPKHQATFEVILTNPAEQQFVTPLSPHGLVYGKPTD